MYYELLKKGKRFDLYEVTTKTGNKYKTCVPPGHVPSEEGPRRRSTAVKPNETSRNWNQGPGYGRF